MTAGSVPARGSYGRLRVTAVAPITPAMLRLTVAVEEPHLPLDPSCPNQVLRLSPPDDDAGVLSGARPASRTYTIRRANPATGLLDLDVVLHGDGLFVRWARTAAPGDTLDFTGPRPHAVPSLTADAVVMATDETGLPALAAVAAAAPSGLAIHAVVEVADAAEEQPLPSAADLRVTWLHRDGAAAGTTGALERAVRSLPWPSGAVDVWVAGEAGEVRAIRRFAATDRGVERHRLHAFGYWRRGRAGSPA
ncbi:siderophore-interacting protein [Jiangella sp. DSM 45060]|uniref:siderophore-interacting protein n=1 Tax=Jiangella sp. DSM 45060 TaxID=1798224 RepID=UPI00087CD99F|nr:siderophore-interacting protein [Jiangella sp. DSM 45060]SDT65941.1 NADPH-dependent ferric siderophore reductase, contains FAD-binding and SIP domains [Jiangella sp. DSM 45060]